MTSHPGAPGSVAPPRVIAWEVTRSCNLACVHCRASAVHGPYEDELSTAEAFATGVRGTAAPGVRGDSLRRGPHRQRDTL